MAYLGIKIPENIGTQLVKVNLPGTKEEIINYHITLVYFYKLSIAKASAILPILYDTIKNCEPFDITTKTIACFPKIANTPVPIFAKVKSLPLFSIRNKIIQTLENNNIEFSKIFRDFTPHITLSFHDSEISSFSIPEIKHTVNDLFLSTEKNGMTITFPLKK
jgi:2'-5' RNA ligase